MRVRKKLNQASPRGAVWDRLVVALGRRVLQGIRYVVHRGGSARKADLRPDIVFLVPSLSHGARYWSYVVEAVRSVGVTALLATVIGPEQVGTGKIDLVLPDSALSRWLRAALCWTGIWWFGPGPAWRLVRSRPRAVVCVEYGLCTLWTAFIGRLRGVPVWVFHEHVRRPSSWDGPGGVWLGRLDRVVCRLISGLARGVLANTPEARQQALLQYRVSVPVVQIPLLTVPSIIRRAAAASKRDAVDPGDAPRPLVAGFLGGLVIRKGVDILIRAAALAREHGAILEVRIGGSGPEEEALRSLSRDLGVDDIVRFCGPVPYDQVGEFLGKCDVVVLPTRFDYRAVVVLEALACGVPVITTTADGNAGTTVRDGANGLVVPPDDPDSLAARLVQLAADRVLLKQLAAGAAATPVPTLEHAAAKLAALLGVAS
jgi:glycosyltransferase involved in cell wall biosynthesis